MLKKKKSGFNDSLITIICSTILCALFVGGILLSLKFEIFTQGSLGIDAVNYLYNFKTIDDLDKNDKKLKDITTESAYESLTVTNSDKALNTYLKFKDNAVSVEILSSGPGKVVYTLHSDSLSDGRKFIFLYEVNLFGKIANAQEFEAIPFY